jgi:hypothetical protein
MKLIENKYSMHLIKPNPMCIPVPKKRSTALVKAQQKYYEKNKEQITIKQTHYNKTYSKMTHVCECGDVISNSAKYSHIKSKRHLRRVDNIQKGLPAGTTHGETIIDCECSGHYKYNQRHQHFRTNLHRKYEAENQQERLKNQLRRMLLEEDIEEEDIEENVNSNQIKVL